MDPGLKAIIFSVGGRVWDYAFNRMTAGAGGNPVENRIARLDRVIQSLPADNEEIKAAPPSPRSAESPADSSMGENIATACVPCAIGHFAGAARLLNEAVRFRDDGLESDQVIDDIAAAIGELNAMERVDLTPERLQRTPGWERSIADDALRESRGLRHRLEAVDSMEEVEKAAADTESFYKKLNRQWYKGRFQRLGREKAEAISRRAGGEE